MGTIDYEKHNHLILLGSSDKPIGGPDHFADFDDTLPQPPLRTGHTSSSGDADETRPKNTYVSYIIKY